VWWKIVADIGSQYSHTAWKTVRPERVIIRRRVFIADMKNLEFGASLIPEFQKSGCPFCIGPLENHNRAAYYTSGCIYGQDGNGLDSQ
jgi:hypothetical protein